MKELQLDVMGKYKRVNIHVAAKKRIHSLSMFSGMLDVY